MFSISLLKSRARIALKENFWRCVLVGLVMFLFCYNTGGIKLESSVNTAQTAEAVTISDFMDANAILNGSAANADLTQSITTFLNTTHNGVYSYAVKIGRNSIPFGAFIGVVTLVLSIFVFNVLNIGGCRFFLMNQESDEADVKELLYGFRNRNYSSMVSIMLLKDIKVFLWAILFVIPGIMKSYEYMLIPYILAENPDMEYKDAFAESKRLMTGSKWDAFILDLSFIGWSLLSNLTFGLSGIFYSNPYMYATKAEMYRWLQLIHEDESEVLFDAKYTDSAQYSENVEENM